MKDFSMRNRLGKKGLQFETERKGGRCRDEDAAPGVPIRSYQHLGPLF